MSVEEYKVALGPNRDCVPKLNKAVHEKAQNYLLSYVLQKL